MKKTSDISEGQRSWSSSAESSGNQSMDSSQIYGSGLTEAYKDDLYKNQWIPLAIIAVFLLMTATCVSIFGELALQYPEPTRTPSVFIEVSPSPIPASPTATVMPSPTPTLSISVPVVLRVLPSTANMRIAPNITARIIGQIKRGSQATPLVQSSDGRWLLVVGQENGITGWVAIELFETISGDPKTLPTIAPTSP